MSKITSCFFTSTIFIIVFLLSCNLITTSVSANLTVSSGNYSNFSRMNIDHNRVCEVDGLRLWIKSIYVLDPQPASLYSNIWESDFSTGTMIDLRSTGDISTIDCQVDLPITNITTVSIFFYDHYEIKTYTFHENDSTYYYTSRNGVQSTSFFEIQNPPSDYDFLPYPFIYPSRGDPVNITRSQEDFVYYPDNISIINGEKYKFAIYIDLTNASRFWDGDPSYKVDPFSMGGLYYSATDFFPDNVPAFGIISLPFSVAIFNTSEYTSPVMETYITSLDNSDLISPRFIDTDVGTMSFVFLSENSPAPIYGNVRDNGLFSNARDEYYARFIGEETNTFFFISYSFEGPYVFYLKDEWIQGSIYNFPHLSVDETGSFTATATDGTSKTYYTKRIK